uniref:Secreted protein n=1 Tax=Physcomitrium patens TaxID=3218 RepID=A0A2K1KXQ4_PHYPA|nr:hypothetical protein PHYPA_005525 [Physcomitrium patens]
MVCCIALLGFLALHSMKCCKCHRHMSKYGRWIVSFDFGLCQSTSVTYSSRRSPTSQSTRRRQLLSLH